VQNLGVLARPIRTFRQPFVGDAVEEGRTVNTWAKNVLQINSHFARGPAHEALIAALTVAPSHQTLTLELDGLGSVCECANLAQAVLQPLHDARVEEIKHTS